MPRLARSVPVVAILALVATILVGLLLRFMGLGWGRPFVLHPDEWVVANPAMDMVRTGSWNPDYFLYPSGLVYVERLIVSVMHQLNPTVSLVTASTGGFAGLPWRGGSNALPEQFPYFYAGRAFVAVVGALTVLPTFYAARSVSNLAGGLAAAVVVAVAPLAVLHAHFLTTDVPTAALTASTLALALRGMTGGRRWLIAAAFAAGMAASTKYNGGLVVMVPLVVLLTSSPPRELFRRSVLATGGMITLAAMAGFVLLTPALLFDTSSVWTGGILFQLQQYSGGHPGAEGTDNALWFLRVLWTDSGLGPGISILVVLGLLVSVIQRRRADIVVLSFVVAYYILICLPPVRFERNLVPLIPFLAVLAGRAVGWLVDMAAGLALPNVARFRPLPTGAVGLAVLALVLLPSVPTVIARNQLLRSTDTREIARRWIADNIPAGAAIAREEFTPQLSNTAYRLGFEWLLANRSLEWYRSAGFEYVVTSNFQFDRYKGHPPQDAFYEALLSEPVLLDLRPEPGQQGPRVIVVRLRPPDTAKP